MARHSLIEPLESRIAPANLLVTNVRDDGAGSLRVAIEKANATPEMDLITFKIRGDSSRRIVVESPLPELEGGITIDAGEKGIALISPDALLMPGLVLSGDENVVRGLAIGGFAEAGMKITGDNNLVTGCLIGAASTIYLGTIPANGTGMIITGDRNVIGGFAPGLYNSIAGNLADGILLTADAGSGAIPEGNLIDGSSAPPYGPGNGRDDIRVEASDHLTILHGGGASARLLGTNTHDIEVRESFFTTFTVEGGAHTVHLESNAFSDVLIPDGTGVEIGPNVIKSIDLGAAGKDANDTLDADSGANGLLNSPQISQVTTHGLNHHIVGSYDGLPNTTLRVLFNSSYYQRTVYQSYFIGEGSLTTDANGHADFAFDMVHAGYGTSFFAWAVDPATGDSSENSTSVAAIDSRTAVVRIASAPAGEHDLDSVFNVIVSRDNALSGTVTVPFSVVDGTAEHDLDFSIATTMVTFSPDQLQAIVPVVIKGDQTREALESFQIVLGTPTNATLDPDFSQATIEIRDDDHSLVVSADHKTATWIDEDGDLVTLKSKQPIFDPAEFTLVDSTTFSGGDRLAKLDLRGFVTNNQQPDLIFTVKRNPAAPGGDGKVDVGFIDATGVSLGKVSLPGDLGRIEAGDNYRWGAIALQLGSLGARGLATQAGADSTNPASLVSVIKMSLGALKVSGDINGAHLRVDAPPYYAVSDKFVGAIGSVTIGGDLIGGATAWSGSIEADGWIGKVEVAGEVLGGPGAWSGAIHAGVGMGQIHIGGDLTGGIGFNAVSSVFTSATGSGSISAGYTMGAVTIDGSVHGGDSDRSGSIFTEGGDLADIDGVKIVGALTGRSLDPDGHAIFTGIASSGRLGAVKVREISGAASDSPVQITAAGRMVVADADDALAFGGLTTKGDVSNALVRAGYALDGTPITPYVRVGAIKLGGDWNASSVLAGAGFNGGITPAAGVIHTFDMVSSIASITIAGETRGTVAIGDLFGFAAREIRSFESDGDALPLTKNLPGVPPDDLFVPNTDDVVVREVAIV